MYRRRSPGSIGARVFSDPATGAPRRLPGNRLRCRFSMATESGSSAYILISSRTTPFSRLNSSSGMDALRYMSESMSIDSPRYSSGMCVK